ncbi:MAG: hypothetical protein GXO62_02770 [Epsilonproteobacteria bacterium]|nr:hypothetical protein [Campylobacterota bacterium]
MKFLLSILLVTTLFGFDIDKEIEKLQKLPPEKRYKLMNKIKTEILKLNEKERLKILKKLFKSQHPAIEENPIQENQTAKGEK